MGPLSRTSPETSSSNGQSFVEFASALVIMLIILAGIVDLGRVMVTYIALREAAEEGASFAAFCPDNLAVENRVRQSSSWPVDLNLRPTDPNDPNSPGVTVNASILAQVGVPAVVTVRYNNYPLIMPFIAIFIGGQTIDIQAEARSLILQFNCPE